ncbi:MAG: lmo0937 family membrane protein [Candidatus Gottesmanbacteria bacterium]
MSLLDIIIIVLVIAWLGGFSLHVGGELIHLLLVIAIIVLVARFLGVSI